MLVLKTDFTRLILNSSPVVISALSGQASFFFQNSVFEIQWNLAWYIESQENASILRHTKFYPRARKHPDEEQKIK